MTGAGAADDGEARPTYVALAVGALSEPLEIADDEAAEYDEAGAEVDRVLDALGWDTDRGSAGHDDLVRAVVALHRFAPGVPTDVPALRPYADAVRALADSEIPASFDSRVDTAAPLRFSVLGTVLYEPVLLALRKLAHVDRLRQLSQTRAPES